MRNFHKFNSQADFEAMYNDQADNEVTAIGIANYSPNIETGQFDIVSVDYYDFVGQTSNGAYYWGNGYYTVNRNPSIGEEIKNNKGVTIPGYFSNVCVYDVRIAHESAYVEPWVSYTVGRGVDYSKPPQEPIAR